MQNRNEKKEKSLNIIKYVLGIVGVICILLAVLTVTDNIEGLLTRIRYTGTYDDRTKLVFSLTTSILGILLLFVAFSRQIDRFFGVIEKKELKLSKSEDEDGLSIELIFFLIIAIVLIVIAVLLGIGYLTIRTQLPILGKFTETFLIGSLVVLALLALFTAFNEIIGQSIKEMKKVHWPTSKQMTHYSIQVFTFILFFSFLFYGLDLIVTNGLAGLDYILR
jgi:preprotein translocase SecE subunit